jgi:O-antigen/teichoic acid export membrane protein
MKLGDGLLRGASASFLMRVVGMGLSWLVVMMLTRLLGAEGYGTYAFLLSAATVLSLPANFGASMLLVREVGAAQATENWGRMRGAATWALRYSLLMSLPIVAAAILTLIFLPHLIPPAVRPGLFWAVGLVVLMPLTALRGGILRGLRQVVLGQAPEQIVRPTALLLLMLLPFAWGQAVHTPAAAMAANVGANAIAWVVGALILARFWPREARAATPTYESARWRASLLPLGLSNGMYVIDGELAVLILGVIATREETGVFKAAAQFALFAELGYAVVNVNIAPRLAAAWAKGDRALTQRIVTQGARLSIAYCIPVALALIVFGKWGVPLLLGKDFEASWPPLVLLCLGQIVNAAFGSANAVLNMAHHEKWNTVGFAAGLAANVILTLILTPLYGAVGAAAAMACSVTLRNLIVWRYASVKLGIETGFWSRAVRPPADRD